MKTTAAQRIQPLYATIIGMLIYTALISTVHFSVRQLAALTLLHVVAAGVLTWERLKHDRPVSLAAAAFILGGSITLSLSSIILGLTELFISLG